MEVLQLEHLKQLFIQIDTLLSEVEVKGDSVQKLATARQAFGTLFNNIKQIEEKPKPVKKGA